MAVCIWTGATDGKFLTEAGNWTGAVPVSGDSVIIPADASVDIDDELNASAVDLIGFTVEKGCTIAVGTRAAGVITSLELSLKNGASYYDFNCAGTGTMYFDIDDAAEINITAAGAGAGEGEYGTNIVGTSDAAGKNALNITCESGERVSLGANTGDDLETDEITVTGGTVAIGAAVTENDDAAAPDLVISGGDVSCKCPLGTVTKTGGTFTHEDGALAALNEDGGVTHWNSDGTLAAANVSGELDFSDDLRAKTVSACTLAEGGTIRDPNKKVTWTTGIDLYRCGIADVTLDLGQHLTVSRTAI